MSMAAILLAVRDEIRSLGYRTEQCEVMADGQPPPIAGDLFIAVHEESWNNQEREYLGENFGVLVTLTMRTAHVPVEKWGTEVIVKEGTGLDARLRKIVAAIHGDAGYQVIARANTYIKSLPAGFAGKFIAPLQFRDGGRATPRGPSWFGAVGNKACALSQTMAFREARRDQEIEEQKE